jgi:uncharacterized membrane protein
MSKEDKEPFKTIIFDLKHNPHLWDVRHSYSGNGWLVRKDWKNKVSLYKSSPWKVKALVEGAGSIISPSENHTRKKLVKLFNVTYKQVVTRDREQFSVDCKRLVSENLDAVYQARRKLEDA